MKKQQIIVSIPDAASFAAYAREVLRKQLPEEYRS